MYKREGGDVAYPLLSAVCRGTFPGAYQRFGKQQAAPVMETDVLHLENMIRDRFNNEPVGAAGNDCILFTESGKGEVETYLSIIISGEVVLKG